MTQAQKTVVAPVAPVAKVAKAKPAKAKPAKAKQETTQEPKTPFCKALYIAVLAGQFGNLAKAYYVRADDYHKKQKTIFPRARTAGARAEMTKEKAQQVMTMASKGVLASGNALGQALYDLMRTGADLSK